MTTKMLFTELVKDSNLMRPLLTNLNTNEYKNSELYGTAPFRARGIQANEVDIESGLRTGKFNGAELDKDYYDMREQLEFPSIMISDIRPKSTRADRKNNNK